MRPLRSPVRRAGCLWAVDAHADALILTLLRGVRPAAMLAASLERLDVVLLYYFVILLAVHLARYHESTRAAELSASRLRSGLAEAELHLLRNQIRPHFLFNSLNVISELTREDPIRAGAMIEKLGDLLRLSLELGSSRTVPLHTELQLVSLYLDLQQMRFEEWLHYEVAVDAAVRDVPVPAFLLQPLIENAIQHGILPAMRPGHLRVSAARIASGVELIVRDDGVGVNAAGTLKKNIGLNNTEARLERLYGAEFAFTIQRAAPAGTEVVIRIPDRPQVEGHEPFNDGASATHDSSGPAVPDRHSYV
jgi:LytS/YehU family sensor histidine kinase